MVAVVRPVVAWAAAVAEAARAAVARVDLVEEAVAKVQAAKAPVVEASRVAAVRAEELQALAAVAEMALATGLVVAKAQAERVEAVALQVMGTAQTVAPGDRVAGVVAAVEVARRCTRGMHRSR